MTVVSFFHYSKHIAIGNYDIRPTGYPASKLLLVIHPGEIGESSHGVNYVFDFVEYLACSVFNAFIAEP